MNFVNNLFAGVQQHNTLVGNTEKGVAGGPITPEDMARIQREAFEKANAAAIEADRKRKQDLLPTRDQVSTAEPFPCPNKCGEYLHKDLAFHRKKSDGRLCIISLSRAKKTGLSVFTLLSDSDVSREEAIEAGFSIPDGYFE